MTTLVMAAILLFGILGYRALAVSDLPNVDYPTIQVTASLPGANPDTMASAVATPLEKQFSTIAGIDSMTSTSTLGTSQITLQFDLEPQHRRRRAGRAGGHRARRPAAAAEHAHPADLQQGEPGGHAHSLHGGELAHAAALHRRSVRRDAARAAHLHGQGRGAGA